MPKSKDYPTYIAPERLYPLKGFMLASGINATRMSHARQRGIELRCLKVGKRKFVRGADAIAYIERLAETAAVENATIAG